MHNFDFSVEVQPILEYLFEYSHVEELLELLVAVVDAELLKAVGLEIF